MQGRHDLVQPPFGLDQLAAARAGRGEPPQEPGVHRLVDAEGEDPGPPGQRGDRSQDLVLRPHLAVGDEDQEPVPAALVQASALALARRASAGQQGGRHAHRVEHLGAAAGLQPGQPLDGGPAGPVGGRRQCREAGRALGDRVEGEHREPVARPQRVDDPGRGAPGRDHLPAAHAARPVQHHDDVPAPRRTAPGRPRHDRDLPGPGHRVVLVRGNDGDRGRDLGRDTEAQHDVPVQPLPRVQGHRDRAVAVGGHRDRVQAGSDRVRREPQAAQPGAQREPHRAVQAGQQDRRGDPARVGNSVGVGRGPGADRQPVPGLPGDVAGRDDQREAELGHPVIDGQRAGQGERDHRVLAGLQVADPRGEHAGALFLGDRRTVPGGDRLVVLPPGLAALAQLALDAAAGQVGRERRDPGPIGQREDIGGLDADCVGVAVGLPHGGRGDRAADLGLDLHGGQREGRAAVAEPARDGGHGGGGVGRCGCRHGVAPW